MALPFAKDTASQCVLSSLSFFHGFFTRLILSAVGDSFTKFLTDVQFAEYIVSGLKTKLLKTDQESDDKVLFDLGTTIIIKNI